MKCHNLFSGKKNKKNISICRLLKILPSVLTVNPIKRKEMHLRSKNYVNSHHNLYPTHY